MPDAHALERTLASIEGRGYASYKQITGRYNLGMGELYIDRVQVDPFAPPSLMRLRLDRSTTGLPEDLINDRQGRIAVSDYLTRAFARIAGEVVPAPSGTGNSGLVSIGTPGQQVLERTNIAITDNHVEARIAVGLPASGRKARGRQAAQLLTQLLPRIAERSLRHQNLDHAALRDQVTLYRDQEELRYQLASKKLVAFVGDGAVLPRRAGDSDLPLEHQAKPFTSPESLQASFTLPSGRTVTGMGIPEGVTVIVGGGYHGKSTLLRAIERGVYPHVAGDGREWVITRADAVSIRAEDGRAVTGSDISPFITGLPAGTDTRDFSTTNASGSTSQAANLVEAVEAGATAILIDEDTSATNFMIRDQRMRRLIPAEKEPITPFIDRIRPLYTERGVSTVLVAGGSGAFFDVADHVIALDEYSLSDVTARAHALSKHPAKAEQANGDVFGGPNPRRIARGSLNPKSKTKPAKPRGRSLIQFGQDTIDLSGVIQLVDPAQTEAIAHAIDRLAEEANGVQDITELIRALNNQIDAEGLEVLSPRGGHPGHLARPRVHELHAAVNRYRRLQLL